MSYYTDSEITKLRREIQHNRKEIDGLIELLRKDRAEIERLQRRIDVLHEHDGTMCPLCAMEAEIERLRAVVDGLCDMLEEVGVDSHSALAAVKDNDG